MFLFSFANLIHFVHKDPKFLRTHAQLPCLLDQGVVREGILAPVANFFTSTDHLDAILVKNEDGLDIRS